MSVRELWSRYVDWYLTGDNSKFLPAFEIVGGNDIDLAAGTSIPIFAFLKNGWRIKPQETHHTLVVNEGVLLVEGGGDPFNNTSGAYTVRINYQQPVQAIAFSTGGGGGASADDIWNALKSDHVTANSFGKLLQDMESVQRQIKAMVSATL